MTDLTKTERHKDIKFNLKSRIDKIVTLMVIEVYIIIIIPGAESLQIVLHSILFSHCRLK